MVHKTCSFKLLIKESIYFSSANQTMNSILNSSASVPSDVEILHEAKMLREHKGRLESRMKILEDHNLQLESQLGKLKMMLHEVRICHNN